ncbi:hypothetical protein AAFM79_04325 [Trichormus azollae HNT15244]
MRRISIDNMEIKHWQPESKYPELQIDYKNLLASCSGNRGSKKDNQYCNPRKGDTEITYPLNTSGEKVIQASMSNQKD